MQFANLQSYYRAAFAVLCFFLYGTAAAQTSYTWNGSSSSVWNEPANWTPSGIPLSADNVTIPAAGLNQPLLDAPRSVNNLTVSGGALHLNGFTLTVAGATGTFSGGTVANGTLQLTLTGNATFSGTTFDAAISGRAGGLLLNGSTFNNTVILTKTGGTSDLCNGNNTFNGTTSITNSGTSYIRLANYTRDVFNADVTFTNSGTSYVDVARHDANGTVFNGNILVNSTSGTGIYFCQSPGTGVATLAAGKTIGVGDLGFTAGTLALRNFIQAGTAPLNLTLSGTGTLSLQSGSVFNGDLWATAPSIMLNGSTFNGTVLIEKTGGSSNTSLGGNVFNGNTTIINSGTSFLRLANSTRDIFNADITFTNTGSSNIDVARHDATGTEFNGNIVVNNTGGTGIWFCQGNGAATLADGKTIQVGSLGFTAGTLILQNFSQKGSLPQSLTLSGTGIVSFQSGSTFNGPVTVKAPGVVVSGTTFNAAASFEKTGISINYGTGGNTFNGITTFTNSGTNVLYLNNTGTDIFNDDIIVNSTSSGSIRFGYTSGTATLAAGKTIRTGATGFSSGTLMLRNFTQLGSAPVNLSLSGTASVAFQPGTVFGGNISVVSPALTLEGTTFNGTASIVKTGAGSTSAGGNTFNGETFITNSGSSFLRLANTTRDVFNADVTFSNNGTSSSSIEVARNDATGTVFNGNVFVNSTSGSGIYICPVAGTGTAMLAAGRTISTGSAGFTAGGLYLRNFVQDGTTPQSIALGGTAAQLHFLEGTVFNGNLSATARSLFLSGTTFNGSASLTKTGSAANAGTGGCTFNGPTTITNSGTGALTLASTTGDDFNGPAYFVQRSTGLLQPAFNAATTFAGDISTEGSVAAISFANGTNGSIVIDGSAVQTLRGDAAFPPQVQRLMMATSGDGKLQLQVNLIVLNEIAFTSGIIGAVSTGSANSGVLVLQNGISFSDAPDNNSHVTGYVRKVGNTAFTFPTGSGTAYRPIAVSAPALLTDHFTAAYFQADPDLKYPRTSRNDGITYLSHREHWLLDRTGGNAAVTVTLSWDEQSNITDPKSLLVARWDGNGWVSEGNGGISESGKAGTLVSGAAIGSFSPFTFGSVYTPFEANAPIAQGALPVELISFTAAPKATGVLLRWRTATEKANEYFTVERSADGKHFEEVTRVKGSGTSSTLRSYEATDLHPLSGTSYYRLKQTDVDGAFKYAAVVAVDFRSSHMQDITVYPNPSDGATIALSAPAYSGEELYVSVVDAQGKVIHSTTIPALAGNMDIKLEPAQRLKAGVYVVKITGSNGTISKKLVVQ